MTLLIETHALTKSYGDLTVVDSVELAVPEGSLFGFLGPNGSGKTTTIRMILGLVFATGGTIDVLGQRVPEHALDVLGDIGVLVEGPGFYPFLPARKNLALIDASGPRPRGHRSKQRIDAVLELVGLDRVGSRPVKTYSLGMRQRLGIAAALLRTPRLLILDEPTNGLDPNGIHELRSLFVQLVEQGTTVFLSSHQLSEVEMICTDVAMMSEGRLVAQDRIERLLAPTGRVVVETVNGSDGAALADVAQRLGLATEFTAAHRSVIAVDGVAPDQLNAELVRAGVAVRSFTPEPRTLESVFLDLTEGDALR